MQYLDIKSKRFSLELEAQTFQNSNAGLDLRADVKISLNFQIFAFMSLFESKATT